MVSRTNALGASACGCPPITTFEAKNHRCQIYEDKVIAIYSILLPDQTNSEDIYIQKIPRGESGQSLCRKEKTGTRIFISNKTFGCACGNRLVLFDDMSAPGTGSFAIFDILTGAKIFEDQYNDEPIEIKDGKILYFSETSKISQEKCPKDRQVGFGCRELTRTNLDLNDFKKLKLKEKRIIPIQ